MEYINRNSELADQNDFDGVIEMQDLMGFSELKNGNNPIEPYEDATGKKPRRRASRLRRGAAKVGSGPRRFISQAQANKAKKLAIKDKQAQANIIAAKSAGKSDPALEALVNQPAVETPKSNNTVYWVVGGLAVAGIVTFLIIKKPWKKK